MNNVEVDICIGTACFVMGANKLQEIGDYLPEEWQEFVEIKASPCLNLCGHNEYSKAPYVKINGEIMAEANIEKVLRRVEKELKK